jgi:AhpD family alkylhydroperoxidase
MEARMKNAATVLPTAMPAIKGLYKSVYSAGIPRETLELVHLRASQINGCSPCVDSGMRGAVKAGISPERLWSVAAWNEAPYYTDAERAALALAESVTRLADRATDAVSDDLWAEVEKHYSEEQRAGLILWIATTNLFNRLNASIKEPAGATWS